jgi:bacillithiol biosynthesis deacetylase BshB1
MKLDILAIAAHPDDVELSCSGTLMKHIEMGYKVGVIDLTRGDLGTRGTPELRLEEAQAAAKIMGISARENMRMADGFFKNDREHQLQLIQAIRKYQPEIIFANAVTDRHIDHGRGSSLISDACFLSGLVKIETYEDGKLQDKWRPKIVYYCIQDRYIKPDFVVDITPYIDRKMESILAYRSQFFNESYEKNAEELQTPISGKDFFEFLKARCREMGRPIGAEYAEGFTVERTRGVENKRPSCGLREKRRFY